MKSIRTLPILLAFSLYWGSPSAVLAQVEGPPNRVDYQGQVLDTAGNPLAPATPTNYTMQFRLYDAQTGGTLLWSETQTVTVSKGEFSVRLGEGIAIPEDGIAAGVQAAGLVNAFRGKDRFLGVTVVIPTQTPAEITPRLAFLTSPFSFVSQKAQEADSMTILDAAGNNRLGAAKWDQLFTMSTTVQADRVDPGKWKLKEQNIPAGVSVPVGGVIMWWGAATALPAGFELCTGGAPTTAGALIALKPDLRDRFVKGSSGTTGNVATSNVSGGTNTTAATITGGTSLTQSQLPSYTLPYTLTADSAGAHTHQVNNNTQSAKGSSTDGGGSNDDHFALGGSPDRGLPTLNTTSAGAHTHTISGSISSGGGNQAHTHSIPAHDNRPAFLEMFYIIRVK